MVATLPRNIQLKLEQSLAQWHSWRCETGLGRKPEVLKLLSSGLSNYSVLVEAENRYVVRIDGLNPAAIGLSRQTEWRVMQLASDAGLAPKPRYFNPELGTLVYDYLAIDTGYTGDTSAVASLLGKIHELPAVHFRLDLLERMRRYEKHIEHRGDTLHPILMQHREQFLKVLDQTNTSSGALVLCHNDLLQANRIPSSGQFRAIDWEYCAMGRPLFDLAVVCVGDSLNEAEKETLLHSYLGRGPGPEERLEMAQQECIYRYLELLWFSALDNHEVREKQLTEVRFQQLADSLR